jgi:carboxymethylenebutenolidase
MAILSEWVTGGEGLTGFFARPERAAGPLPGLLILQEAWGVDAHIEDVTRRFAGAGYAAFAPDLYAAGGVRPTELSRERMAELVEFMNVAPPTVWTDAEARAAALAPYPAEARARLEETRAAMGARIGTPDALLPVLDSAVGYLRGERPETRGQKIGSIGFCLGGGLSARLACHDPELAAAVIFYGMAPPTPAIGGIRCPLRGFYGGKDARITSGVPAFVEAMRAAGKSFEAQIYPEAGHAFFNDGRPAYDASASRDAFSRTLAFFREALG